MKREYFKQGKIEQFRQILEEGSSSGTQIYDVGNYCLSIRRKLIFVSFWQDIDEYYADVKYERIAILNALGAYYSYLGKTETKHREKEEQFILATRYYNKASRIDMHEPSTWVGKGTTKFLFVLYSMFTRCRILKCNCLLTGQLLLAKGEIDNALQAFKIVLDTAPDNVPALLGQV